MADITSIISLFTGTIVKVFAMLNSNSARVADTNFTYFQVLLTLIFLDMLVWIFETLVYDVFVKRGGDRP